MLHQPAQQFSDKSLRPTRVAQIASEYERWAETYRQACNAEDRLLPDDPAGRREELRTAQSQAVRLMNECIAELMTSPSKTLHDLGLKARVLREDATDWYSEENNLTRSVVGELMQMSNLPPIKKHDFSPTDLLPEFVEPEGLTLPLHHVNNIAAPAPTCPVGEMGRRFQHYVDLHNALDRKDCPSGSFGKDSSAADQILSAIGDHAPFVQADSAEGALFQVIIAAGAATRVIDLVPKEHEDYLYILSRARELDAALTSVRRFLEQHFGLDGQQLGGEYCMPDRVGCITRLETAAPLIGAHAPEKPQEFMEAAE